MGGITAMRLTAPAQFLGTLLVCLDVTAPATAAMTKAKLTVQGQYQSTEDVDQRENGETTKGTGKTDITFSVTSNVYIESGGTAGTSVRGIPEDEMTDADRPQASGTLTISGETKQASQYITISATQNFKGSTPAGVLAASAGSDHGGLTLGVGLSGDFKGHCVETLTSKYDPPRTTTDCTGNLAPVAGIDQFNPRSADSAALSSQDSVADAEMTFNISSRPRPPLDSRLTGAAAEELNFIDQNWYGAKITGNAQSGFNIALDSTRTFSPEKGTNETKHLHVTASIRPLNFECTLNVAKMRAAMARALASRQLATPPQFLTASQKDAHFLTYAVRLGGDGDLLPTQGWVKDAVAHGAHPQPGARFLLLGSAQLSGETYRVTARIVETETGTVLTAGKSDGDTCASGLDDATAGALVGLYDSLKSYVPS